MLIITLFVRLISSVKDSIKCLLQEFCEEHQWWAEFL